MSQKVSDFLMIVPMGKNELDPFSYYDFKFCKKFKIEHIRHFEFNFWVNKSELLWYNLKRLHFCIILFFKLLRIKNKFKIFTRDPFLLAISIIASKFNLNITGVFFEAHKTYPKFNFLLRKCSGIVVTNQYNFDNLLSHNGNLILERNGVELQRFNKLKFKKLDIKNINVCYIGSFQKWKGFETLIKAFSSLEKGFNLILVGARQSEIKNLNNMCDQNGVKKFQIYGHMNQDKLINFYKKADVLVLPNSKKYKDNLSTSPIKLFEYMATKRPIIASNIDSIREILSEKCAIFFESDNSNDLALKIKNIIDLDHLQIAKNSFNEVKNYTWKSRADRIVNFIFK